MSYHKLMSKFAQIYDPDWPHRNYKSLQFYSEEDILVRLCSFDFDFESWLYYKLQVSRADPSEYIFRFPNKSPLLNFEEYHTLAQAELSEDITYYRWYHFYGPTISPHVWSETRSLHGALEQRAWWMTDQWNWIRNGFPVPPDILWHSESHLRQIGELLIYNPFLDKWGDITLDFSIKLSDHLDHWEDWDVLQTLIWIFEKQGKEFPSPSLYYLYKDQFLDPSFNPSLDTLILPPSFWKWVEHMNEAENDYI